MESACDSQLKVVCPRCCRFSCVCECDPQVTSQLNGSHGEVTQSDDVNAAAMYANALKNPLHPSANGCRIPDEYATPTQTMHVKGTLTLTSTAAGLFSAAILPNPHVSVAVVSGSSSFSGGTFASNADVGYMIAPNTTKAILDDFRVVSFGIRIRNVQPPGTATGMLEIAQVPAGSAIPSFTILDGAAATNDQVYMNTFANGILIAASGAFNSLLNLPDSDEYAVQELMANDIEVAGKICSAEHATFRNTNVDSSWSATQQIVSEGQVWTTSTGGLSGAATTNRPATMQMLGRTVILINGRGFPASTRSLDVEIVYHIEGTPAPVTGITWNSGSMPIAIIDPNAYHKVLSQMAHEPASRLVESTQAHKRGAVGRFTAGLGEGVRARLGLGPRSTGGGTSRRLGRGVGNVLGGVTRGIGGMVVKEVKKKIQKKIGQKVNQKRLLLLK